MTCIGEGFDYARWESCGKTSLKKHTVTYVEELQ